MQSVLWLATVGLCAVFLAGCSDDASPSPSPSPTPTPGTVQAAWDNHLEAFGLGVVAGAVDGDAKTAALDQIMLDYTENSIVRVFNTEQPSTGVQTHTGITEIREMFNALFTTLDGCANEGDGSLNVPQPEASVSDLTSQPVITENGDDSPGSVLLMWQCTNASVNFATDTFHFTGDKIAGQNIVIAMPPVEQVATQKLQATEQKVENRRLQEYNPANVSQAWNNHATAFLNQNVSQILLDYVDESVVLVWEWTNPTNSLTKFTGLAQIEALFTGLFAQIGGAEVMFPAGDPVVTQRADAGATEFGVFLNWAAPAATPGIVTATDTFIFGQDLKIKTQTVVTNSAASLKKVVV